MNRISPPSLNTKLFSFSQRLMLDCLYFKSVLPHNMDTSHWFWFIFSILCFTKWICSLLLLFCQMSFSNKIVVYTCAINVHPACVALYVGAYILFFFKKKIQKMINCPFIKNIGATLSYTASDTTPWEGDQILPNLENNWYILRKLGFKLYLRSASYMSIENILHDGFVLPHFWT